MSVADLRRRFRELHETGTFLMPNAWDIGSARLLESLGFPAIATTSSGFAASLGRADQSVTLDELVGHVAAICAAVDIPVSVDAEDGYSTVPEGLSDTVGALASAGAAGLSIEDFRPGEGLLDIGEATERVASFSNAASRFGLTVTGRAENHLYGVSDLDDTVARLVAYADAGADVLYAPGLVATEDIGRVVAEVGRPVNVLLLPGGPSVGELQRLGVRRLSTGGALAFAAYGAAAAGARELLRSGTVASRGTLSEADRESAFGGT